MKAPETVAKPSETATEDQTNKADTESSEDQENKAYTLTLCGCDCGEDSAEGEGETSRCSCCECKCCGIPGQGCKVRIHEVLRVEVARQLGQGNILATLLGDSDNEKFKSEHPKFCGDCRYHGLRDLRLKEARRSETVAKPSETIDASVVDQAATEDQAGTGSSHDHEEQTQGFAITSPDSCLLRGVTLYRVGHSIATMSSSSTGANDKGKGSRSRSRSRSVGAMAKASETDANDTGKGSRSRKEARARARQGQGQGQERTCANNPLATCPPSALTFANCHVQRQWPWNIDEDEAARAAIRAEADAVPESTVAAIMFEALTRDATGFNGLPDTRRMSRSELSRLVVDDEENAPLVGKGKSKDGGFGDKGKSKGSRSRSRSRSVGAMQIVVQTPSWLSGSRLCGIELKVNASDTIQQMKAKIKDRGIPCPSLALKLDDSRTLGECGLQQGSVVYTGSWEYGREEDSEEEYGREDPRSIRREDFGP